MSPDEVVIIAKAHGGSKCPRCWHYHYLRDQFDGLCERCQLVIMQDGHDNAMALQIKTTRLLERKKFCVRPDDQACPHIHCCRETVP